MSDINGWECEEEEEKWCYSETTT